MVIIIFSKNKIIKNLLIILSFVVFSLISALLLLKNNTLFNADDMTFHLRRIMDLKDSILNNDFFPNFSFNRFHGSCVMSLYPYLNLFPLIILSFFIKSKIALIYSFFIFNTLISLIISYYSSKSYVKFTTTSYIFAIIYSLSNNFLTYNFTNMDLGLVSTYIFLPIIVFAFIRMLKKASEIAWIELSIGMSLVFFSHILSLFIIILFLLIWLLINIKMIDKKVVFDILKSILLFFIISSVAWLPLIYIYIFNFHNIISPGFVQLSNINIKIFLSGLYGSKKIGSIGVFPLITLFISLFFYKNFKKIDKQMYFLSLMIVILVLFFPWSITSYSIFNILNQFQYTYRLLIIPQILLSFIFSIIISIYINSIRKKNILFIGVIIITLIFQLIGQYGYIHNGSNMLTVNQLIKKNNGILDLSKIGSYKITNQSQFYKIANGRNESIIDYIPLKSYSVYRNVNNNQGIYNYKHLIYVYNVGYNKLHFYDDNNKINRISLPIYMYNNEKLYVYLNGKKMKYFVNKDGLLTLNNIRNHTQKRNNIYITTSSSNFRLVGVFLSVLGWLFALIMIIKRKFAY